MGRSLIESETRAITAPTERVGFVTSALAESYRRLLSDGGIITQGGRVLSNSFAGVHEDNLSAEQVASLRREHVLRLDVRRDAGVLPDGRRVGPSRYFYLIESGALNKIYNLNVVGGMLASSFPYAPQTLPSPRRGGFYIEGADEQGNPKHISISADYQLVGALKNHAHRILVKNGILEPGFPLARYTRRVLLDVLKERQSVS